MACCLISFLCEYLLLSHKFYFLHCQSWRAMKKFFLTWLWLSSHDFIPSLEKKYFPCWQIGHVDCGLVTITPHRNLKSHWIIDTDTELETIFSWDSCVLQNISIRNIKLGESQSLWCNQLNSKSSLCSIFFHLTIAICRDENFESLQLPRIVWSLSHLLKFPFNLLLTRFWHFCM